MSFATTTGATCADISNCSMCSDVSGCYWSADAKKCGPTKGGGYQKSCKEEGAWEKLQQFLGGVKYKGTNIKTSDGVAAYVTETGVIKQFPDATAFAATAGSNGCPVGLQTVNAAWGDLGIASGSAMVAGQTCGNEAQFLAAAPPQNNFDPKWYSAQYGIPPEQDALQDWTTNGQAQGRPPNGSIMASMAQLGKVGYVDPNAQLHNVPSGAVKYVGYKSFLKQSNVVGTSMVDCGGAAGVKYGDLVQLVNQDSAAALSSDNVLVFGGTAAPFSFVVRPTDTTSRTPSPVKFGDSVSLSASSTNYSNLCGAWGCKVSQINNENMTLEFGPGQSTGGTPLVITPANSGNAVGDTVPYDTPFFLSAQIPTPYNALFQGDVLKPGMSVRSANDKYNFTFQTDGFAALYVGSTLLWKSDVGDANPTALQLNGSGALEAINADGVAYWQTDLQSQGTAPFFLAVQDNGIAVIYDANMTQLWTSGTSNGDDSTSLETVYATISKGNVVFSKIATSQATFTFSGSSSDDGCDLQTLKKQCGDGCVGFVVDPTSNEWQPIQADGSTEFTVAATVQDFYLKTPSVQLGDPSCPNAAPVTFLDATTFQRYPAGADFTVGGTNQCATTAKVPSAPPPEKDVSALAADYDPTHLKSTFQKAVTYQKTAESTANEAKKQQSKLAQAVKPNLTLEKQDEDSQLVDRMFRSRGVFWMTVAAVFIVLVFLNQATQGQYLGTAVKAVAALAGLLLAYAAILLYERWF